MPRGEGRGERREGRGERGEGRGERGEGRGERGENSSDMSSKASHFQVAQGAGSAVVAPDPLISLNTNSCSMLLFISYYYFFFNFFFFCLFSSLLVLIRLRGHLATAKLRIHLAIFILKSTDQ